MDQLIRDYLTLLNSYAVLQQSIGKSASNSFINLSRCRYNNVKLFTENFRAEFNAFITVERKKSANKEDASIDEKVTIEANKERFPDASIQSVVSDSEKPDNEEVQEKTPLDSSSPAQERNLKDASRHDGRPEWNLKTGEDKKKDPMRDIERLPSQSLRTTRASFRNTIEQCIALGNVYVELQQAENAIRDFKRKERQAPEEKEAEMLPLSELSINEQAHEALTEPSITPAKSIDASKSAGPKSIEA